MKNIESVEQTLEQIASLKEYYEQFKKHLTSPALKKDRNLRLEAFHEACEELRKACGKVRNQTLFRPNNQVLHQHHSNTDAIRKMYEDEELRRSERIYRKNDLRYAAEVDKLNEKLEVLLTQIEALQISLHDVFSKIPRCKDTLLVVDFRYIRDNLVSINKGWYVDSIDIVLKTLDIITLSIESKQESIVYIDYENDYTLLVDMATNKGLLRCRKTIQRATGIKCSTLREILKQFEKKGLIHRPNGERGGYGITQKGLEYYTTIEPANQ